MTDHIRFRFAPRKAAAALHWILRERGPLDLHQAMKACYFADKAHLNAHGRPVFGATYRAMRFGPVPLEIYEMAKSEPLWLAELGVARFPWRLDGYHLHLVTNEEPNLGSLSHSDRAALEDGLALSVALTFTERTAATHGPDWQAARMGRMRYEDMIEDAPEKAELVAELRETAPRLSL